MEHFDETILQALPEPAFVAAEEKVAACNAAARAAFPGLEPGAPMPGTLLLPERRESCGTVCIGAASWQFTAVPAGGGTLFLLRPAVTEGISVQQLDGVIRRLREQMSGMLLSVQMLERETDAESRTAELNRSLCRMLRLVDHLDLLRSLEAEEAPFRPVTLDLAGLCREVVDAAAPLLYQTGVGLEYSSSQASLLVSGDPRLQQTLLLELIANGSRAAGKGGRMVLNLSRRDGWAVLTLTDSGEQDGGDPLMEILNGQTGACRLPRPGEGAGLGFALVQRIVALHRGRVVLERRPGIGFFTTAALPLAPEGAPLAVRTPQAEYGGGISPVLVELSELLPAGLYSAADLE